VVGWGESCRSAAGYGGRREYFLQSAWARSVAMAIGGGCDGGMCGRAVGRGELVSMVGGTAPLAPFDCAEASWCLTFGSAINFSLNKMASRLPNMSGWLKVREVVGS
jgi:hypothetical protein